ncbi:hypothetical protein [Zoogloea sp.]
MTVNLHDMANPAWKKHAAAHRLHCDTPRSLYGAPPKQFEEPRNC